jgi:hypothetical protein
VATSPTIIAYSISPCPDSSAMKRAGSARMRVPS